MVLFPFYMNIYYKENILRKNKKFNLLSLEIIYTGDMTLNKDTADDTKRALRHVSIFNIYGIIHITKMPILNQVNIYSSQKYFTH